ncbi:E3 ubiquitin-protein ligase RNF13 [Acropora cervicornis]|uniref:E3 ubiquitin-protein ligase RNF13 n=1 Tax=Acropora cervicornis TaxID=6130 RepID=A0AAD9R6K2_ACRCE|nr:E3 ubiquitin-protein ligase RNF13 [Acropora cervicornis]
MKARRWWVAVELLSLWLCQVCYGSLGDNNQICVKLKNDSSTVQCHYCALATFSEVVAQQMTGVIVKAEPAEACREVKSKANYNTSRYIGNWFLLIDGDGCDYETKTLYAIDGEEEEEFTIPVIYVSEISRYYRHYLEQRRNRLSPTNLRKIPTKKFKKAYHCKCVDPWLTEGKRTCPVCKRPAINDKRPRNRQRNTDVEAVQETNNEPDETTPLISPASLTSASTSLSV